MTASIIQEIQQVSEKLEQQRQLVRSELDLVRKQELASQLDLLMLEHNRLQLKYLNWQATELKRLESQVRGF